MKNAKLSYKGIENVAIYAFSSGKILDVRKIAGVKNMTNIMSVKTDAVNRAQTFCFLTLGKGSNINTKCPKDFYCQPHCSRELLSPVFSRIPMDF